MPKNAIAHAGAMLCILFWGTSFISSKIVLESLSPVSVMFLRAALCIVFLFAIHPRTYRMERKRDELWVVLAALLGVFSYQMLENNALTMTYSSNVCVIASTAPCFTVLLARAFDRSMRIRWTFFLGFAISIAGIYLISFGSGAVHLSLKGDLLALAAAVSWGGYSVVMKRLSTFGIDNTALTRRIFEYALLMILPFEVAGFSSSELKALTDPVVLLNIIFLGAFCSAFCFGVWNYAIRKIGAVESSVYIYLSPSVTLVFSFLVLGEPVTALSVLGVALTVIGLLASDKDVMDGLRNLISRRCS